MLKKRFGLICNRLTSNNTFVEKEEGAAYFMRTKSIPISAATFPMLTYSVHADALDEHS